MHRPSSRLAALLARVACGSLSVPSLTAASERAPSRAQDSGTLVTLLYRVSNLKGQFQMTYDDGVDHMSSGYATIMSGGLNDVFFYDNAINVLAFGAPLGAVLSHGLYVTGPAITGTITLSA